MFINNHQAVQTLDILAARHQKIIDESQKNGPSVDQSPDEIVQIHDSHNALSLYNSLKQKYQLSV